MKWFGNIIFHMSFDWSWTLAPATSGKAFIDAHSSYLWTTGLLDSLLFYFWFVWQLLLVCTTLKKDVFFLFFFVLYVPIFQGITYGWAVFLSLNLCVLPTVKNGHSRISVQLAGLHWTFQNLFFWRCICLWLLFVERLRKMELMFLRQSSLKAWLRNFIVSLFFFFKPE